MLSFYANLNRLFYCWWREQLYLAQEFFNDLLCFPIRRAPGREFIFERKNFYTQQHSRTSQTGSLTGNETLPKCEAGGYLGYLVRVIFEYWVLLRTNEAIIFKQSPLVLDEQRSHRALFQKHTTSIWRQHDKTWVRHDVADVLWHNHRWTSTGEYHPENQSAE